MAAALGRMDVCVCNAGVIGREPALDMTLEEFERVLAVNVVGAFAVSRPRRARSSRLDPPAASSTSPP